MSAGASGSDQVRIADGHPVVVFDGVCNLCDATVRFILDRDPAGRFRFAANQSAVGRELLARHGLDPTDLSSVYLIEDGRLWARSTAVLRIVRHLRRPWPLAYGLILVPRPVRDLAYRVVARLRYRLFGRRKACRLPRPGERSRFLDATPEPSP